MSTQTRQSTKITREKRGRPKLSTLPDSEQARLRMKKIRKRRRRENLVPIEVWIPKKQRDSLLRRGGDLSAAATEAFGLLIESKRRTPPGKKRSEGRGFHVPEIDLDDVVA